MKKYLIFYLFVLLTTITGCSNTDSEFKENGTFAVTIGSTTVTPGGGTTVSAKYTTNNVLILEDNDTVFSSSRPDLITFSPATVKSDKNGAAATGLAVVTTVPVQTGGVDVVIKATFRGLSDSKVLHVNPSTATSSAIKLTVPALANQGSNFAISAVLSPVAVGDTVTFTSSDAAITFEPVSAIADGSGTAKSTVTVKTVTDMPQNGLDVTVTATFGSVKDLQVVHISGSTPAAFSMFPTSLDISNIPFTNTTSVSFTRTIQIVPTPSETPPYNYSAASRAPFIIKVASINQSLGIITLETALASPCYDKTPNTGAVIIEIKNNSPLYPGPTLFYPVSYSLCF